MLLPLLQPASLVTLALLIWTGCGLAAAMLAAASRLSSLIAGLGSLLASIAVIAAAVQIVSGESSPVTALPVFALHVEFSPLNALLLLTIAVTALFSSLYACAWLAQVRQRQRARTALGGNLLLAALTGAAISASAVALILTMELAALCAYFLIVQVDETKSRRAGLNQFL